MHLLQFFTFFLTREEMSSSYSLLHLRDVDLTRASLLISSLTLLYCLYHVLRSYLKLSHVPGPFLASLSNLPRVSWVSSKRAHEIHIELHEKYGDLVRFGPNMVSVADPAEIPTIYPMRPGFVKVRISRTETSSSQQASPPVSDFFSAVRLLQSAPTVLQRQIPA